MHTLQWAEVDLFGTWACLCAWVTAGKLQSWLSVVSMSTSLPLSMAMGVAKTLVVGGQGHPPVCLWLGGAGVDTWWSSAAEHTTRKKKKVQWGGGGKAKSWRFEGLPVPGLCWTLLQLVFCGFPEPLLLVFAVGAAAVWWVIIFQSEWRWGGGRETWVLESGINCLLIVDADWL